MSKLKFAMGEKFLRFTKFGTLCHVRDMHAASDIELGGERA